MQEVEKLWTQAKLWHKCYGRQVLDSRAATAEEKAEKLRAERKAVKAAEKAKAAALEAKRLRRAEAEARGEILDDSEDEAIGEAASAAKDGDVVGGALVVGGGGGDALVRGGGAGGARRAGAAADEDDESAYLNKIQEEQEKEKARSAFWRRDAFINDESDEEGEEGAEAHESDEALEPGQREKSRPLEMDRLDSNALYEQLHSESQRLLRQATAHLPCHKEKAVSLPRLLSKIGQRQASHASQEVPEEAPVVEEEAALAAVLADSLQCHRCQKTLDTDDTPLREATPPGKHGRAGLHSLFFCSKLCLEVHRAKAVAIGSGLRTTDPMDVDAEGGARALAKASSWASTSARAEGGAQGADADEDEDDDAAELLVLPPAIKATEQEHKTQLQKLMTGGAGGGASVSRWGKCPSACKCSPRRPTPFPHRCEPLGQV